MNIEKVKTALYNYITEQSNELFEVVEIQMGQCCQCHKFHWIKVIVNLNRENLDQVYDSFDESYYLEMKYIKDINLFFNMLSPNSFSRLKFVVLN